MTVLARLDRWRRWLLPLFAIAVVGLVLLLLDHELRAFRYHEIAARLREIPLSQLGLSLALTVLVYAVLPLYDFTALAYLKRRVPYRQIAFSSTIAYAISQTLGFAPLTGGGIRYRFWSQWGIGAGEIARGVSFVGVTFAVGVVSVNALVLLLVPTEAATLLHLMPALARAIGALLLAIVIAYQAAAWRLTGRTVRLAGIELVVPGRGLAATQFLIPIADWLSAAAVMYALLPALQGPGFLPFVAAFVLAQFVGIVSHVPGGAGVFEAVMLALLGPLLPADQVVATLLAYRVIYYGIPFVLGAGALAANEAWRRRGQLRIVATATARWGSSVTPAALAAGTFLAGVVLLFSGAAPSVHSRVSWLVRLLPIGVIEVSHFTGSLLGLALLVLAWALWHRLDTAWTLAIAALALGAVASLLKGLDWEEAVVMTGMLALLIPARGEFYRKAALLHEPLEPGWVAAIVSVVGASIWLGVFSYKHVEFAGELWWQFTVRGDAPRFLRASAGAVTGIALFGAMRLLRHSVGDPQLPDAGDLQAAAVIAAGSSETGANLALLGDKCLLFSAKRDAMLMYGVEGRSWIALGDPVGPDDACAELAWEFRESADEHGAWPVFYEVTARRLPLYIDLGLSFVKLGEEAIVPLAGFSLEGAVRKGLRRTQRDMSRDGVTLRDRGGRAGAGVPSRSPAHLRRVARRQVDPREGLFNGALRRRLPQPLPDGAASGTRAAWSPSRTSGRERRARSCRWT